MRKLGIAKGITLISLAAATFAMAGCGGSNLGSKVKPKRLSAGEALGDDAKVSVCTEPSFAKPRVIDLATSDRGTIERGMKQGVLFVRYDCATLKVLEDCTMPGDYAYAGSSKRFERLTLKNSDELKANLPIQGGSVSGGLQSGNTLELGMMDVGGYSTAAKVNRGAMVGSQCKEATHYVKSAALGAFAMRTGEVGKVMAKAQLFGVGTEGGSASTDSRAKTDGNLKACEKAKSSDDKPIEDCQSPLRLTLLPVPGEETVTAKADGDAKKTGKKEIVIENPCPPGYEYIEGKCTKDAGAAPKLCKPTDAKDCKKQCEAGNMMSCHNFGLLMYGNFCKDPSMKAHCDAVTADNPTAEAKMKKEELGSMAFFKKACDADIPEGCYELGSVAQYYWDKMPKLKKVAEVAYDKGCALRHAESCGDIGYARLSGSTITKDVRTGLSNYLRACRLGDAYYCQEIGKFYFKGEYLKRNPAKGMKFLFNFCKQGDLETCEELASHLLGNYLFSNKEDKPISEIPKSEALGRKLLDLGCKKGRKSSCFNLGRNYYNAKQYEMARKYLAIGAQDDSDGYIYLGNMYFEGQGGEKNTTQAAEMWLKSDNEKLIHKAATMFLRGTDGVLKNKQKAAKSFFKNCKEWEYKPSCMTLKGLSANAYRKAVKSVCESETKWACDDFKRMDYSGHKAVMEQGCKDADSDPKDFFCKRK